MDVATHARYKLYKTAAFGFLDIFMMFLFTFFWFSYIRHYFEIDAPSRAHEAGVAMQGTLAGTPFEAKLQYVAKESVAFTIVMTAFFLAYYYAFDLGWTLRKKYMNGKV
jgi:hypothetical protein